MQNIAVTRRGKKMIYIVIKVAKKGGYKTSEATAIK